MRHETDALNVVPRWPGGVPGPSLAEIEARTAITEPPVHFAPQGRVDRGIVDRFGNEADARDPVVARMRLQTDLDRVVDDAKEAGIEHLLQAREIGRPPRCPVVIDAPQLLYR